MNHPMLYLTHFSITRGWTEESPACPDPMGSSSHPPASPLSAGILKKYEKDERKARIAEELVKFEPTRPDLYVPTNPDCRVLAHIPSSGTPMQSAAKVRGVGCAFSAIWVIPHK